MRTIHKFVLAITDEQFVPIKGFVRMLSVLNQREQVVLYAEVDPDGPNVNVSVQIFGTGHSLTVRRTTAEFIGSVSMAGGDLVWHVYAG